MVLVVFRGSQTHSLLSDRYLGAPPSLLLCLLRAVKEGETYSDHQALPFSSIPRNVILIFKIHKKFEWVCPSGSAEWANQLRLKRLEISSFFPPRHSSGCRKSNWGTSNNNTREKGLVLISPQCSHHSDGVPSRLAVEGCSPPRFIDHFLNQKSEMQTPGGVRKATPIKVDR